MTTLSIIVPVYNVEPYLTECLDSILIANHFTGEIICIDDGCTDNCPAILDDYASRYSNLRVIRQSNRGLSAARNVGLRAATSDYVMYVDSDDMVVADSLHKLINEIEREDILYFGMQSIDAETLTIEPDKCPFEVHNISGHQYYTQYSPVTNSLVCVCRGIYRRQFLIGNRLYNLEGHVHEDEDFTPRALHFATSVSKTETLVYTHRIHRKGSITTEPSITNYTSLCLISYRLWWFSITHHCRKVYSNSVFQLCITAKQMLGYRNISEPITFKPLFFFIMLVTSTDKRKRRLTAAYLCGLKTGNHYADYTLPKWKRKTINILIQ